MYQVLFVGNIDENSVATMENEYTRALNDYVRSIGSKLVVVCAKLEFDVCYKFYFIFFVLLYFVYLFLIYFLAFSNER